MKVFIRYKKPKINYIKIDPEDTWNMDNTLALIILPMLKQIKSMNHTSALVDDKDVPPNLRTTGKRNARWNYVLDEMIWAFEQLQPDAVYYMGVSPENKPFDKKEYLAREDRIKNGTSLFGKYYRSLWD